MKRSKSEYSIQTVDNALRILEAFQAAEELGVTELARRLGLHKNNVFRLLATLGERGYVEQSESSERYRLGVRCVELARGYTRHRSLARLGRDALETLVRSFGETAHLACLRCFEVVHLDGETDGQSVGAALRVGERLPAHCTALGKVLLAGGGAELAQHYDLQAVARGALAQRTSSTITDRDKFFEHLSSVAVQGFAIDQEECEEGLVCAAAPVQDAAGRVVAALSIAAPGFRLPPERLLRDAVPAVRSAAEWLSHGLGHTP